MATDSPLMKLRRKRLRVHVALRKLEPLVADYHAKLAEIEAEMQRIDPNLFPLPTRHRRPNPIFARGQLPRLAMSVMRAEGKPLPVAVIARRCLAAKGVDRPGPGTMKTTKNRLQNLMVRRNARGLTCKVGTGNATRRGLVTRAYE